MPKNKVSDLITDQEIAFALLVLAGTMTDHAAANAVGLNPDTAAYTKAKPRVRAYMLEHRAAMQQQLLDQESERLRKQELRREQVLDRLWEISKMSPEMTRGSITGQVKALAMIVAIEGLIPDRRAEKKSAPPLPEVDIYPAAWLNRQQEKNLDPQPDPAQEENKPGLTEPEPLSTPPKTHLRPPPQSPTLSSIPPSLPSPVALAPRKRPQRRLMLRRSCQTPEFLSRSTGTPLPGAAEQKKTENPST
jgi:hypothetical protein